MPYDIRLMKGAATLPKITAAIAAPWMPDRPMSEAAAIDSIGPSDVQSPHIRK
jgi:hypothetical protein